MQKSKFASSVAMVCAGVFLAIGLSAVAGQSPNAVNNSLNSSGYYAPQNLDSSGNLKVNGDGWKATLNITASSVVETGPGAIVRVVIASAPSAAGAIYDSATIASAVTATKIAPLSASNSAGTVIYLNWPTVSGIVVDPGASGVVAVSYE